MSLLETIKNVFREKDLVKLNIKISDIGDVLEGSNLSKKDVIEDINCLFSYIKEYEDESVIENILNISLNIMNEYKIFSGFDLKPLLSHMDEMNYESISYVLTFLGFSGDDKYIKIIEPFLKIDELREDAEEALMEINYRINQ